MGPNKPYVKMGDFTFNYIFQKVINSSTTGNTSSQAPAGVVSFHWALKIFFKKGGASPEMTLGLGASEKGGV